MDDEEILRKLHPNVPYNQLSLSIKELMQQARADEREKMRKEHRLDCHDCCEDHYEDGERDGYKKGQAELIPKIKALMHDAAVGMFDTEEEMEMAIKKASESLGTVLQRDRDVRDSRGQRKPNRRREG